MLAGELYYLHKNFLDLSQKYNITYHSHITTNGSLLNKKLLNNINFDKIQLTFDGDKEIHEKFKVSNNFRYEDLFKKINLILKESDSFVRIRFNISKENKLYFEKVLKNILEVYHKDLKRLNFYFSPLRNLTNTNSFTELSPEEFSDIDWDLRKILTEYGIKLSFPKRLKTPCKFPYKLAICTGPSLKSYYCTSSFDENDDFEKLISKFNKINRSLHLTRECINCEILPLCLNACRYLEKNQRGCPTEKFKINQMVIHFLENREKWIY